MRKLVYHVAATLDNFISREDGSTEGFPDGEHVQHYFEMLKNYDTVVMGKGTYEAGYRFGMKPGAAPYQNMQHYVFSKTLQLEEKDDRLHIVQTDAVKFVKELKSAQGQPIYLCGGGALAGTLLDAGLIDQVILKLNPLVYGHGIRMFGNSIRQVSLELKECKTYNSPVVLLTYDVKYS
jgi:dihydrofolate reductase